MMREGQGTNAALDALARGGGGERTEKNAELRRTEGGEGEGGARPGLYCRSGEEDTRTGARDRGSKETKIGWGRRTWGGRGDERVMLDSVTEMI